MQNPQEIFTSLPLITKTLLVLITILTALYTILPSPEAEEGSDSPPPSIKPLLTIVPSYALIRPWTPLTAPLTEPGLFSYIVHVLCLGLMGPYFERIWGRKEFIIFVGVVGITSVCCASGTLLIDYAATLNLGFIFETEVNGLGGIICGFIVAFKQTIPEHTITVANTFSLRVKHIPSLVILVHFILFLLRLVHVSFLINMYGTFAAWIYIRFYKTMDGIRGDRSETFSFVSFFPDALHPVLKPLSSFTYRTLVRLKFCPPLGPRPASYLGVSTSDPNLNASLRSTSRPADGDKNSTGVMSDADRRRALALRELDKRLQMAATSLQTKGNETSDNTSDVSGKGRAVSSTS